MSVFDEFRAATAELFDAFELPAATIVRETEGKQANADRAAGRKGAITTLTLTGRGVLGNRKLKLENGTIVEQSVARLNIVAKAKDRLTIGDRSYDVLSTEEIAPDGLSPFVVIAVLK